MAHISYSELKNWCKCPWYHKLVHLDKIGGFEGNEYTAFGTALHNVCENKLLKESIDEVEFFELSFLEELKKLPENVRANWRKDLIAQMREQGKVLAKLVIPELGNYFADGYKVLATEEKLMEKIEDTGYDFKGFIDLVVHTPDNKVHIIDWKTCSWGWDTKRRSEPMTTYQLTLYKNYYAQKYDVDVSDIETHFALLKRTAKKDQVEIFRVTSGPKKTKNALTVLNNALHNISNKNFIKNRLACQDRFGACEFFNTEHCRR
jgi:hypothetical protein